MNPDKQQYENAQKLGERVERMCNEEGWKEHFIPIIRKKRDEAQAHVNSIETDLRKADFYRGQIEVLNYILGYENEKKNQALTIMHKSATKAHKETLD
jgi:hypothetical protein